VAVRRLGGTQVASSVALIVAGLVAIFFEPLPPLVAVLESTAWTRLIEWFGVSIVALALLSWVGVTDMEFEVSSNGIKARRIPGGDATIEELKEELQGMKEDNRRLMLILREELTLRNGYGGDGGGPTEEDADA